MQVQSSQGIVPPNRPSASAPVAAAAPAEATSSASSIQKADTYEAKPIRTVKASSSNSSERRQNTIKAVATVGVLAAGIGIGFLLGGPIGALLGMMVALVIGGGLAVWQQQKAAAAAAQAQAAQARPNTYPMGTPIVPTMMQFSAPVAAENMPGQQDVQTRRDAERQS